MRRGAAAGKAYGRQSTMVQLTEYTPDVAGKTLALIQGFWLAHNQYQQSEQEARDDLTAWTKTGHRLYLIQTEDGYVGFVHLGSRGGACDWLEDIFVHPAYQNRGIGTQAILLAEEQVRTYSPSMYIEAAARNERAIALYHRLGYCCLNTVSVRKDFPGYAYDVKRKETLYDRPFEIRTGKA